MTQDETRHRFAPERNAPTLPDMLSGNIEGPVIMLAERAADMIRGRPQSAAFDPREENP